MTSEQEKTILRLNRSRKQMLDSIAGLNKGQASSLAVTGNWTIKDLLGHITAWDTTILHPLELFHAGSGFITQPIEDYLAWNDDQAKQRAVRSFSQTFTNFCEIRSALIAAYESLPADMLPEVFTAPWGDKYTISKMISGLAWHEAEHAKEISQWREGMNLDRKLNP